MKKCLIVVDYQNDFVDGSLGFPGAVELELNIVSKIKQYRQSGDEVIFTFDTHDEDYLNKREGRYLPVPHCLLGTQGHELYGSVADLIMVSDKAFTKNTFGSEALFEYLKTTSYESIELVGVVSNVCVFSNAVLARTAQPEAEIIIDAACTASHNPQLHTAALETMEGLQMQVINR